MKNQLLITIDGPAAAGKSTISKALSKRISYACLDTGALYRAIAYKVSEEGISSDNEQLLSELCKNVGISLKKIGRDMKVFVDEEDVTQKIRTEEIGLLASKISAVPVVRRALLSIQRKAGDEGGIIAEGRDMGTVVFPHADIKFFLDADMPERAKRRYLELLENESNADFDEVRISLVKRDQQDTARNISPLKPSDDAIIIDTTSLGIEEVVEKIESYILNINGFAKSQIVPSPGGRGQRGGGVIS